MQFKQISAIAVLLLVVTLISVAGCISNSSTPTPTLKAKVHVTATPEATTTPTAKPTATPQTGQDSFIVSMINALNQTDSGQAQLIVWYLASAVPGSVGSVMVSNNKDYTVTIVRFDNVARATEYYNAEAANQTAISVRSESPNAWGLSYYTAAAGHAPTTQQVETNYVGGQQHQTIAQYDTVVLLYMHDDNPSGS